MSDYWNERWNTTAQQKLPSSVVDAVIRCVEGLEFSSVLDYGCGKARWKPVWDMLGKTYTGYDSSEVACDYCRANGVQVGHDSADLVFTNTVLIHADDSAADDVIGLAGKYVLCVETVFPEVPNTQFDHMRYRSMPEFVSLFDSMTVELIERVEPHHLFLFSQ